MRGFAVLVAAAALGGCGTNLAQQTRVACNNEGCGSPHHDPPPNPVLVSVRARTPPKQASWKSPWLPPPAAITPAPVVVVDTHFVHVHVSTSEPITLHRWENGGWTFACAAPCENQLPVDYTYLLMRAGAPIHAPFVLKAPPEARVVIDVTQRPQHDGPDIESHEAAAFATWGAWMVAIVVLGS
jgi:hypothetical protein